MPKVTIDGKTIEVPANTLVVEAAKPLGVHIPVFCYHPKMLPVGMCRMCLVEIGTPKIDPATKQPVLDEQGNPVINWMPKLQTGCTTSVSEGMAVRTVTQAVVDARRSVIEFLLTSHPLDCPICDKGGECPLQDHSLNYGPGKSRFYVESKFHNEKAVPLSPLIMLDRERCIQCARCIRFQDEMADEPVLGFAARGRGLEIVTLDDPPFNSNYSGNTIDICPVGALTSRDFRFTARVFELNDTTSVCQHCSVGCNILIGERDNLIRRITPRENEMANEIWLCDKGRFVHHYAHASSLSHADAVVPKEQGNGGATYSSARITQPMIRVEDQLKPVSWYEAFTFIGNRLRPTLAEGGGKTVGGIAGDRVSNEDLYLFQKLLREVIGTNSLDHRVGWSQWNAGEELVKNFGAGIGTNLGELGKNSALLVLGADPQAEQPVLRLRLSKAARQGASLIVANGRLTKLNEHAGQSFVYYPGSEAFFVLGLVRALVDAALQKGERVTGLDDFVSAAGKLTVADCANQCGLTEQALRAAAELFAKSENGIVLFGREFMFAMQNDPAIEATLTALILLSGHFGRKNNGVLALLPHNNSMGAVDMGILPNATAGRGALAKDVGFAAKEMLAGKVKVLYVMGTDPARDLPNFRNPGFLIVQDLFLTETAQKADVALPAAAWAERDGTFTNTERRVQLFRAAINPALGESRPDWQIIQDIARELGATWSYQSAADVMHEITQRVPLYAKMSHERLRVIARKRTSVYTVGGDSAEPVQIALGELFGDISGAQWASVAETNPSATFEVKWIEPKAGAAGTALEGGGNVAASVVVQPHVPYLAVTRALLDRGNLMQHSEIIQPRVAKPIVEINSHDAEEIGIVNGDRVRVTFDVKPPRSLELPANIDGRVPQGVISIPNNLDGTMNLPMGARVKLERMSK